MIPETDPRDAARRRRARRWLGYLLVVAGIAMTVANVLRRPAPPLDARQLVELVVPPLIVLAIGVYFASTEPRER